jgi:hypothetical protein
MRRTSRRHVDGIIRPDRAPDGFTVRIATHDTKVTSLQGDLAIDSRSREANRIGSPDAKCE